MAKEEKERETQRETETGRGRDRERGRGKREKGERERKVKRERETSSFHLNLGPLLWSDLIFHPSLLCFLTSKYLIRSYVGVTFFQPIFVPSELTLCFVIMNLLGSSHYVLSLSLAPKTGHLTYHKLLEENPLPHPSPAFSPGPYFRSIFTEKQSRLCHATILSSRRTKRGKHLCLIKKKIRSEHCMLLGLQEKKTSGSFEIFK